MLLKSWLSIAPNSDFSIYNLPYGIFSTATLSKRIGIALGDYVVDLHKIAELGFLKEFSFDKKKIFLNDFLNDFMALGKEITVPFREKIQQFFLDIPENNDFKNQKDAFLFPQKDVTLHFPVKIGDYTDFYSSREHATNVGTMFRDPNNALLPNWLHLPVAYHGRASSIVLSGTDIYRPKGQTKAPDAENPSFGATKLLDFELEMAFIIGKNNELGENITVENAENHIFGMVVFNDWSARDVQTWEYQPLGPFLAKNFASAISPWVVTLEALNPFRKSSPSPEKPLLPYLQSEGEKTFDINLEVFIKPENSEENLVCISNFKDLYWNMSQQLAHHTVNGCNMQVGDMCASGTISGKAENSFGSMLELTWRGTKPLKMSNGEERKFIHDNDTVIMRAYAEKNAGQNDNIQHKIRVGFGEVLNKIFPTK